LSAGLETFGGVPETKKNEENEAMTMIVDSSRRKALKRLWRGQSAGLGLEAGAMASIFVLFCWKFSLKVIKVLFGCLLGRFPRSIVGTIFSENSLQLFCCFSFFSSYFQGPILPPHLSKKNESIKTGDCG
jgi:hypothetical protein